MKVPRYSDSQIIAILIQAEASDSTGFSLDKRSLVLLVIEKAEVFGQVSVQQIK